MSGTVSPPANTPVVGDQFLERAWNNFFGDLTTLAQAASPLANPSFTGTVTIETLAVTGNTTIAGTTAFTGNVGFAGKTPLAPPTITGSRTSGFALTELIAALAEYGLIINSTSA